LKLISPSSSYCIDPCPSSEPDQFCGNDNANYYTVYSLSTSVLLPNTLSANNSIPTISSAHSFADTSTSRTNNSISTISSTHSFADTSTSRTTNSISTISSTHSFADTSTLTNPSPSTNIKSFPVFENMTMISEIFRQYFSLSTNFNLSQLFDLLENKTFKFDLKSNSSLPIQLLESKILDLNSCLSNCSNEGVCKLNKNGKFECLCNYNYTGSKCELDKRICSQNPCLNSIKCEDILILTNNHYDYKCHCKSDLFYGKRCESKINICQNETCSGNGICKVVQSDINSFNETTKCECFGLNSFDGEKCEKKSTSRIIKEISLKTTTYVAIAVIISLYMLIFLMDFHKYHLMKKTIKPKKATPPVRNKAVRLYYTP
jgi:hypothetical protein